VHTCLITIIPPHAEVRIVSCSGAGDAQIVLKRGTLAIGQPVVVGCEWGKVRSLRGPGSALLKELLPGQPAEISGLRGLPDAGDPLMVSPACPPVHDSYVASCGCDCLCTKLKYAHNTVIRDAMAPLRLGKRLLSSVLNPYIE